MICPQCQNDNQTAADFCSNCGLNFRQNVRAVKNSGNLKIILIVSACLLVLTVFCGVIGSIRKKNNSQTETAKTEPASTNTVRSSQQSTFNPLIDFFALANKSAAEIEKNYGKPSLIDSKIIQLKNSGEFRIYNKSGKRFLQVDYYKGKAVAFYLDIPEQLQTQKPEDVLSLCGLDLNLAQAKKQGSHTLWWDKPPNAKPFYLVYIRKFNDSGLFYNCEVQIEVV